MEKSVQTNVSAQSKNNTANTTEIRPGSERETTEEDETCDNRRVPQRNLSSHQFSRTFVQRCVTSPAVAVEEMDFGVDHGKWAALEA